MENSQGNPPAAPHELTPRPPPARRFRLEITIEADTEDFGRAALARAISRFNVGEPAWVETDVSVTGELSTFHNPQAVTGLAFERALREWSAKHGPAKDKGANPANRPAKKS